MIKIYYTYILKCSDNTLYCGYTSDVEARLNKHNSGSGAKYTRSRRPVSLLYYESYDEKSEAMKRESAIKKLSRTEKLELINKNGGSTVYDGQ